MKSYRNLRVVPLASILLIAGCGGDTASVALFDDERFLGADAVFIRGEHIFTDADGIRSAHLFFDTIYQWRDSTEWSVRGVDLTVFEESGANRARVTSLRGRMDPRGERLTAQGQVVVVVPGEDRRIESEELHYDPNGERIWSDSTFTMTQQGRVQRGRGFTSDLDFRNFTILGPGN